MMNTTIAMSFVIPAQRVLLGLAFHTTTAYPLRVKAGIQRIYLIGNWGLSRVASLVQLTGFPLSRE
jgi:hypothetical protein